jgi:hypothetical protein
LPPKPASLQTSQRSRSTTTDEARSLKPKRSKLPTVPSAGEIPSLESVVLVEHDLGPGLRRESQGGRSGRELENVHESASG